MYCINNNNNKKILLSISPIIVLFLGAIVIFGWYSGNKELIQVLPQFVPMQYNTALCFCLISIGAIFTINNCCRVGGLIGILVVLLALTTLLQYIFNFNSGLDELFIKHYVLTKTSHPGRMAPNTAVCFILSGLILFLYCLAKNFYQEKIVHVALLPFISFSLSFIAFLGYLLDIPTSYGWGAYTQMAIHTSIGFLIWNTGIIIWYKNSVSTFFSSKNLFFASIVFICSLFTFLYISQYIAKQEYNSIHVASDNFKRETALIIKENLTRTSEALIRMATRWRKNTYIEKESLESDVNNYFKYFNLISAVAVVNNKTGFNYIKSIDEETTNKIKLPNKDGLSLLSRDSEVYVSNPMKINNVTSVWLIFPKEKDNIEEYFAVLLSLDSFIKGAIKNNHINNNYSIKLIYNNSELFTNNPNSRIETNLNTIESIKFYDKDFSLHVAPTEKLMQTKQTFVPEAILFLGVLLTMLLYILIRSLISLRQQSEQLKLLLNSAKVISNSKTLEKAIESSLEVICKIIKWDVGHAYLISNNNDNLLIPSNIWYLSNNHSFEEFCSITSKTNFMKGEGLPGRILESREPAWIYDVKIDDNFPRNKKCKLLDLSSAIGLPVIHNNKVIIVLEFFNRKKIKYDYYFMQMIEILSDHISKAYAKKEHEMQTINKSKEFEVLAHKDHLTGLLNRRGFTQEAIKALSYAKRHNIKTAILYTDLNKFKDINDAYGHHVGDELLTSVGQRISEMVRKEDLVARFGGDEFVIMLTNISAIDNIDSIINKIISNVSSEHKIKDYRLKIGISIGVKVCSRQECLASALNAADEDLYKNKKKRKAKKLQS